MTDSKLIALFRAFAPRQLSRLGDFLRSPYFNKNTDCLLLFNYLQKYAPDFTHENLSHDIVIERLPTEKPLDEKSLAHLTSRLLSLAEKFMAVEAFLADEWKQQVTLMQQYHNLNLPKHYKTGQAYTEKLLKASTIRDADFYREQLLAQRLFYEHCDHNQREFNDLLQSASDALDIYFVVEKLRYSCEMLNYEAALNIHYETTYLSEVLDWSASAVYANIPAIQVYRHLLLLLTNFDDTWNFEPAKSLIATSEHIFPADELRQLYIQLLNYCTRRINRYNDLKFLQEHLEINKLLLHNGLIFEGDSIPPWDYTNVVTVGLKTGQIEWTRQFIHDYQKRLPEEYRENTFRYNLAQYHYYLKNYNQAQISLLQVEFTDVLLNVSVRSLLIKIYCETEQTELLISYLEATRIFLYRNQLLDAHIKRQMQKFVEFTSKFAKMPFGDHEKLQVLLESIFLEKEVLHRDWLEIQIKKKLKS